MIRLPAETAPGPSGLQRSGKYGAVSVGVAELTEVETAPARRAGARPVTVSVIIVSWNSERFLPGCLESLTAQSRPPEEVIVVDNGSTDDSVATIRRDFPWVRVVPLGENTGYCRANNEGIRASTGEALLFLNSDMVLDSAYLEAATAPFALDERIGSVSGKLLRFDRRTIDSAGQCVARSRRVIERGYGRPDGREFSRPGFVFSVCGAAALYRRATVEDITVGGEFFDTEYFAFSEDLDVGWRARNAGWRARYEPGAVAFHYRGGSGAPAGVLSSRAAMLRRPPELRYHILKNRYLTLLKNDLLAHLLRDFIFVKGREIALLGLTVTTAPALLARMAGFRRLCARALRKRRVFLATPGTWGPRHCGLPSGWIGECLIEETEEGG